MTRVRRGEVVALVGSVGLLVLLFLRWFALIQDHNRAEGYYSPDAQAVLHLSGWGALGWFMDLLMAILIVQGLAVAASAAVRRAPTLPVGVAIVTWTSGALICFILIFVLLAQPGLGLSLPNDAVKQLLPGYLGLACACLVPIGAWVALVDDRVDAPGAAYAPPPARPVPEA